MPDLVVYCKIEWFMQLCPVEVRTTYVMSLAQFTGSSIGVNVVPSSVRQNIANPYTMWFL